MQSANALPRAAPTMDPGTTTLGRSNRPGVVLTACFAKRYRVEIMHSCGFSCPATKTTVRLSSSCFSFHSPDFFASSIRWPSPSGDAAGGDKGLCR